MDEVAVSADGLTRRGQATDPSYSELLAGVRGVEFGAKKAGAARLCSFSGKSRAQYDVRGRRWIDCIGCMVRQPSGREIASQFAVVSADTPIIGRRE